MASAVQAAANGRRGGAGGEGTMHLRVKMRKIYEHLLCYDSSQVVRCSIHGLGLTCTTLA